jgi:glycosyltransferase involved in cell wall biosynthesis
MRVLMAGMHWFPERAGGLNRYFFGMARAASSVGISGEALVADLAGRHESALPLRILTSEKVSILRQLSNAKRAGRAALSEGFEVVNSHFAKFTYPWLSSLRSGQPFVVHFHGPWADEIVEEHAGMRGRLMAMVARHMERQVYRRATRVVTLSRCFAEIVQERYGVDPARVHVVPGGVDTAPYAAAPDRGEARRRLGWPEERPTLVTVRRLVRRMGIDNLVEAMERVRRAEPRVLLLIGGVGPISGELQRSIEARGLTENVRLLGLVPEADLPLAYAAADFSVVPTIALEGFGLVTAEALASGTPVLGTPIGGTREILANLDPSLLFKSVEPEALADGIIAALCGRASLPNPHECREFARQYDWATVMPKLRDVFREAIQHAH